MDYGIMFHKSLKVVRVRTDGNLSGAAAFTKYGEKEVMVKQRVNQIGFEIVVCI
jgi:hypothetical protein